MNHNLELFAQQLQEMQNPRERRGFLDSFYASLVHGKIYGMEKEEVERAAAILAGNPQFIPHASKLRAHPYVKQAGVIPGAELFSEYLKARVGQDLRVVGPKVLDTSYDMDFTRRYLVLAGDQLVGHYYQYGPKPGEEQPQKAFFGQIPGYVNECIVVHNQYSRDDEEPLPNDLVSLVWANERFEKESLWDDCGKDNFLRSKKDLQDEIPHPRRGSSKKGGYIVQTPWQRQDGHDQIPFP